MRNAERGVFGEVNHMTLYRKYIAPSHVQPYPVKDDGFKIFLDAFEIKSPKESYAE